MRLQLISSSLTIMHQIILLVEQFIESVRVFAYALIFLAALLEALPLIGLIIPGGLAVIFGGYLVFRGSVDLGDAIFFATAGAVLGDWFVYALGRLVRLLKAVLPLERMQSFRKAEGYFIQKGGWSLIDGRFMPVLRGLVPLAAGIGKMPPGRFLAFNVGGGVAWAAVHIFVGYAAGASWKTAGKYFGEYSILTLVVLLALYYLVKYAIGHFKSAHSPDGPQPPRS